MRTREACRELCTVDKTSPTGKEVQVTLSDPGNELWLLEILHRATTPDLAWVNVGINFRELISP